MTPTELMTFVRQRYNSVSDDLFSDALLLDMIYTASMELARKAYVIESIYSTTTVASTSEYSLPTNTYSVKRVTYDGSRLDSISLKQYDSLRIANSSVLTTGRPLYYALFGRTVYPYPVPNSALTLKIFSYNFPQRLTTLSTIEIPTEYQTDMVEFMLSEMSALEKNYGGAQYYRTRWENRVNEIIKEQRRRLRGSDFQAVQDTENVSPMLLGFT